MDPAGSRLQETERSPRLGYMCIYVFKHSFPHGGAFPWLPPAHAHVPTCRHMRMYPPVGSRSAHVHVPTCHMYPPVGSRSDVPCTMYHVPTCRKSIRFSIGCSWSSSGSSSSRLWRKASTRPKNSVLFGLATAAKSSRKPLSPPVYACMYARIRVCYVCMRCIRARVCMYACIRARMLCMLCMHAMYAIHVCMHVCCVCYVCMHVCYVRMLCIHAMYACYACAAHSEGGTSPPPRLMYTCYVYMLCMHAMHVQPTLRVPRRLRLDWHRE